MFSKYPAKNLITFKNYDVVFFQKKNIWFVLFFLRATSPIVMSLGTFRNSGF